MTDHWGIREYENRRQREQRNREMAREGGGGGCVLYPLGAIALLGLCCASPRLFENVEFPFSVPHFGGNHVPDAEPKQVVHDYMLATTQENAASAATLTCAKPQLGPVTAWWKQMQDRRVRFGVKLAVSVSTDAGGINGSQASASATATVSITEPGDVRPGQQASWIFAFTLSDEQGWKVCAATVS